MQRREFSLSAASVVAATLGGAIAGPAFAQAAQPKEGADYLVLDKPVPTEAAAGKTEVVEFFWYSCPHCFRFEPQLEAWIRKAPKDVSVRRVPVAFRPDFEPQQRLYYVLETLGKVDELHKKVFDAVHVEKQPMANQDVLATWAEKHGISKAKFTELYNSFPVVTKARKATQLQDLYKVEGVPALGVAGRFYTSGSLTQTMERALQVTDYLIGISRKA
jgi:protein dithiol oxidoreductase (disulfide-forming)